LGALPPQRQQFLRLPLKKLLNTPKYESVLCLSAKRWNKLL